MDLSASKDPQNVSCMHTPSSLSRETYSTYLNLSKNPTHFGNFSSSPSELLSEKALVSQSHSHPPLPFATLPARLSHLATTCTEETMTRLCSQRARVKTGWFPRSAEELSLGAASSVRLRQITVEHGSRT